MGLKDYTTEELVTELASRGAKSDLASAEVAAVALASELTGAALAAWAESVSDPPRGPGQPGPVARCPRCGCAVGVKSYRVARLVVTRGGEVTLHRNYHWCRQCREGFFPKDLELGLEAGVEASPEVERLSLDFALNDAFEQAAERLEFHHGLRVSPKQLKGMVERRGRAWSAGKSPNFSIPSRPGPLVVMADGSMQPTRQGWKECKLACLENLAVAGERFYLGSTRGLEDFEQRLKQGLKQAHWYEREVVWICDGAEWLWKLQERQAPEAFCLLDWYHLAERVNECAAELLGEDTAEAALFGRRACALLWDNRVDECLAELEACRFLCGRGTAGDERRAVLTKFQTYIANHGRFLDYPTARARGYPIGSGPVESAHRSVWHCRLKRPGARWSAEGLESMAQLRILYVNVGPKRFHQTLREAA